jgi:tetratricopeptide (TPR) repeat protein
VCGAHHISHAAIANDKAMRLLYFDPLIGLSLTDFSEKDIPPYAILSHRWGDDEILFEDIGNPNYKSKHGYQKIEFCAKQIAQNQLQYFWVDTCCIDKWDLRERSRAINSMFRWYSKATKCYVFLSDVSVSTATESHQQNDWEASFRASEWFTRGWTLQELIAPVSVEFFSAEGRKLGDKASLEQLIYEITGIPPKALRGFLLSAFTISERIQWANNRETTEEEDNIYCLLGILDVSMPTSYGEGKENASRRLQMEIEAAGSAPSIIPFSRNDRFVGRESELAQLEAELFRSTHTSTSVIHGAGGAGKSHLALELAYRIRQRNKNCSIFWIDASDMDSMYQSYVNIAHKLDLPGWEDQNVDMRKVVKDHLEREDAGQFLLIFDNLDDLSTARDANLTDYLPQSGLCSMVFTTTNSDTIQILAPDNIVQLGDLAPKNAHRMFVNCLTMPLSYIEQQEAKYLLQELSHLPLAILQAAAYINTTNITPQIYRSQLLGPIKETVDRNSDVFEDNILKYDTKDPVATTLMISLDHIRGSHDLAAKYVFLAACIDRKDIPLDFLEASTNREREDAIRTLSKYALVTRRPADSSLDLHRLVHRSLRIWIQHQHNIGLWTQNAIHQLLKVFPDIIDSNRSKWRRLIPHIMYALSHGHVEQEDEDRMTLAWKCTMALHQDGRHNLAEKLDVQVMEMRKRILGTDHPDTLQSINNLAMTYLNQGRWKESEELSLQVLRSTRIVLGDEHSDTLYCQANLALAYMEQGLLKKAEALQVETLESHKRLCGETQQDVWRSMQHLALNFHKQGRLEEAEELQSKLIELSSEEFGEGDPRTLDHMNDLADTLRQQWRLQEAQELQAKVLRRRIIMLGNEHPRTLISMVSLALILKDQGFFEEAKSLLEECYRLRISVLGVQHPYTVATGEYLTRLQLEASESRQAE